MSFNREAPAGQDGQRLRRHPGESAGAGVQEVTRARVGERQAGPLHLPQRVEGDLAGGGAAGVLAGAVDCRAADVGDRKSVV